MSIRIYGENLAWASGSNVVVLPLAAGILASMGALSMSLSTVILVLHAQLRLDLTKI